VQSAIISKHKLNLKSAYFTQYITSSVKQVCVVNRIAYWNATRI